jgi:transcription antitermination factor NusG
LTEAEIEDLRRLEAQWLQPSAEPPDERRPRLRSGTRIRVVAGAFNGFSGVVHVDRGGAHVHVALDSAFCRNAAFPAGCLARA